MKYGNIKMVNFGNLVLIVFLFFNFVFAQELPEEGQVYVCPLATKMEEINPRCECRIDLILGETVTSTCPVNGQSYEMTLTIAEYEGKEYYAIYGFENGGAGMNYPPQAKITGDFEGVVGETLNFSGANSSDPNDDHLDFYWDFGDGSFAVGKDVSHTYNSIGNYLLKLKVEDGLASSTATATVTINEKPIFGAVILLPFLEKKSEEGIAKKEEVKKEKPREKETKFLVPKSSEISFKIPIEKKFEEKEVKSEKIPPKIEKETEKPIQRETFLASLVEIVKGKVLIWGAILISLLLLVFVILKIKNYFWQKRKL